jgi:hypothetical protein
MSLTECALVCPDIIEAVLSTMDYVDRLSVTIMMRGTCKQFSQIAKPTYDKSQRCPQDMRSYLTGVLYSSSKNIESCFHMWANSPYNRIYRTSFKIMRIEDNWSRYALVEGMTDYIAFVLLNGQYRYVLYNWTYATASVRDLEIASTRQLVTSGNIDYFSDIWSSSASERYKVRFADYVIGAIYDLSPVEFADCILMYGDFDQTIDECARYCSVLYTGIEQWRRTPDIPSKHYESMSRYHVLIYYPHEYVTEWVSKYFRKWLS